MIARLLAAAAVLAIPAAAQEPLAADERGLWMQMDEAERRLATSPFVIADPALNAYVRGVHCRLVGPACREVRIYLVRTPYFNASMAPNGMMAVWSGLFLRTRDEAQLAAVLAHEHVHYAERHSLRMFRDVKGKSDVWSLVGLPIGLLTGGLGYSAAQIGLVASIYGYSREMERAADTGSIALLANAGYDPAAAAEIWSQVRAEREATGAARKRRPRGEGGPFASHPASAERMAALAALAMGSTGDRGAGRYREAMAAHWSALVDDQVKLNDFGGTEWLLASAAEPGWTPALLFARAELHRARGRPDDLTAAIGYYRQALAGEGAPAAAHRGLGLALVRAGDRAAGAEAIAAYLAREPAAPDAPMLRAMVSP